jgi:hypothetical protein
MSDYRPKPPTRIDSRFEAVQNEPDEWILYPRDNHDKHFLNGLTFRTLQEAKDAVRVCTRPAHYIDYARRRVDLTRVVPDTDRGMAGNLFRGWYVDPDTGSETWQIFAASDIEVG